MTTIDKLRRAASIDLMGTDSVSGLRRIARRIDYRAQQVRAGLITETEAIRLIAAGK